MYLEKKNKKNKLLVAKLLVVQNNLIFIYYLCKDGYIQVNGSSMWVWL
jgi:hypothetical protein